MSKSSALDSDVVKSQESCTQRAVNTSTMSEVKLRNEMRFEAQEEASVRAGFQLLLRLKKQLKG